MTWFVLTRLKDNYILSYKLTMCESLIVQLLKTSFAMLRDSAGVGGLFRQKGLELNPAESGDGVFKRARKIGNHGSRLEISKEDSQ